MPSITVKEYYARDGSPFSKKDANVIGPVLREMAHESAITGRDVVDAARSENSPLHPYFEWRDRIAADKFRLWQARDMLGSIRVKYTDGGGETQDVRAFQIERVSAYEPGMREYRSFQVLHGDSAFAAQMLGSAFDDLQSWKRKYAPYVDIWQDFGDVFHQVVNQIDEWTEEYKARSIAGDTDDALARLLAWREDCSSALKTWTECRQQIEFIMQSIGNAETVFAKAGKKVDRSCVRCTKLFKSAHIGNRICPSCAKTQKVGSGVGENQIEMVHGE